MIIDQVRTEKSKIYSQFITDEYELSLINGKQEVFNDDKIEELTLKIPFSKIDEQQLINANGDPDICVIKLIHKLYETIGIRITNELSSITTEMAIFKNRLGSLIINRYPFIITSPKNIIFTFNSVITTQTYDNTNPCKLNKVGFVKASETNDNDYKIDSSFFQNLFQEYEDERFYSLDKEIMNIRKTIDNLEFFEDDDFKYLKVKFYIQDSKIGVYKLYE